MEHPGESVQMTPTSLSSSYGLRVEEYREEPTHPHLFKESVLRVCVENMSQ